jgi:predicted DNA-binding protein (UPF0278 family)
LHSGDFENQKAKKDKNKMKISLAAAISYENVENVRNKIRKCAVEWRELGGVAV